MHVIVCAREDDAIPGEVRAAWLRELYPAALIRVIADHYDPDDSALWARLTSVWLGGAPDVVFTSEDYGAAYAAALGCKHELVDRQRVHRPCSGTAIRRDPYVNWHFLSAPPREWYAKRVCVVGAESTGTTTLARALAAQLRTNWVEEFGREYSVAKFARGEHRWRSEEFVHIATEQNRREDAAARMANRVLVCDTNAWATQLWQRRYMGSSSKDVAALARKADLYLLTGDEIPFVQDGSRDGEHVRHDMQEWFVAALNRQPVPWLLLRGAPHVRLNIAINAVGHLFAESAWRPQL